MASSRCHWFRCNSTPAQGVEPELSFEIQIWPRKLEPRCKFLTPLGVHLPSFWCQIFYLPLDNQEAVGIRTNMSRMSPPPSQPSPENNNLFSLQRERWNWRIRGIRLISQKGQKGWIHQIRPKLVRDGEYDGFDVTYVWIGDNFHWYVEKDSHEFILPIINVSRSSLFFLLPFPQPSLFLY